jgi:hypothetical protein
MPRNEEDIAWKDILDNYLKDFIEYCFPELNALIDWSYPWKSLDKELQAITRGTKHGKQLLDKLFEVKLLNGDMQWISIHIEVQARREKIFTERMFVYSYRSYDKYKRPIVSLAVLTDNNPKWRPSSFKIGLAGAYIKSKFLVIKVIDYQNKKGELIASKNIFASVLLAQLSAIESKRSDPEKRKQVKVALVRRLFSQGLNKKEIGYLLIFIDWLIGLPPQLELEYVNEVHAIEEMFKMPYVTTFERLATEKGIEIGIERGIERGVGQGISKNTREIAMRMLERGFPVEDIIEITMLSGTEIKSLQKEINVQSKMIDVN